ncbi:MAG: DNA polymerase III subunit delta [Dehalococcoidales bacterium]|nr:DNA polymerase III subunit delta [Dehalococcoidales bacterium]
MLYILHGQDDFSLAQALEKMKGEVGGPATLAVSTINLEGQEITPEQLKTVAETVPFLTEKRLVIVKGLLGRFEPQDRRPRQKGTVRAADRQNEYKPFGVCLSTIPESTILVLVDGKISNRNPLFRELAAKAVVKNFSPPRRDELQNWVRKRVAEEGGSISPGAVNLLTRLVGNNLWTMASEINKLVLFVSDRRIEEDDVKKVVSHTQQSSVFAMVDAILEFKVEAGERLLQEQLLREPPAYLLFMLARQVQLVVRARELRSQGKTKTEIQNRLGLAPFALDRTLEQAGKYSLPRLKEVYRHLLETDLRIKTGKYDGELALNILVAELCSGAKRKLAPNFTG